jgi:endonuclease IV
MPLFGAHQSIAGGLHNALLLAQALGMDTVQLFVTNPRSWLDATPPSSGGAEAAGGISTPRRHPWRHMGSRYPH